MKPVLISCWFVVPTLERAGYDRLARVLGYTARKHCSHWDIRIEQIHDPEIPNAASGNISHGYNTTKLEWWRDRLDELEDGRRIALMDIDVAILQPLDAVWDIEFDWAYTVRHERRLPLNGGVVFLRLSPVTRNLMATWCEENRRMLFDASHHENWRRRYAGINQASLGFMLERGDFSAVKLRALACAEWNCVQWTEKSAQEARIVHYKSWLRRATLGGSVRTKSIEELVKLWRKLERQSQEITAAP